MAIKNYVVDTSSREDCLKVFNEIKSILGQTNSITESKKVLEIDFSSIVECKQALNIIKTRIGELNSIENKSKNQSKADHFNACHNIYLTNISDLYKDLNLDENPVYYVYTHSEQDRRIAIGKCGITSFAASIGMTHIPFYIGKGIGNRAYNINRNETHRKIRQKLNKFNKDIFIEIIKDNLTEKEALMLESKLIDIFGLIPNGGKLVNLDEGYRSEERKLKYINELSKINILYKELLSKY